MSSGRTVIFFARMDSLPRTMTLRPDMPGNSLTATTLSYGAADALSRS